MSFIPSTIRPAFVVLALTAPAMMAVAQGTTRVETKDKAEIVKPGMSAIEPGQSTATLSEESTVVNPANGLTVKRGKPGKITVPGKTTLAKPDESNVSVTGGKINFEDQTRFEKPGSSRGLTMSDQTTVRTETSRIGVTGGSYTASDSSEMSTSKQSTIRAEDNDE